MKIKKKFFDQLKSIEAKMMEINNLPRLDGFDSYPEFKVDTKNLEFSVKNTHTLCDGSDYSSVSVSFDEINKPISYFEQKFKKEINDEAERERAKEEKLRQKREEEKRATYEKLKKEYES